MKRQGKAAKENGDKMTNPTMLPTVEQTDRAAQYLRETQQGGKRLTPWPDLPKSVKKKWLTLAAGTLAAAFEKDAVS